MNFVQSFWVSPSLVQSHSIEQRYNGGWIYPGQTLRSFALSASLLKKNYPDQPLKLVTDNLGKKYLVDYLQLPYDEVSTSLEDIEYTPPFWSLGKIYAYREQEEPFIHLDGDVFVWDEVILQKLLNKKLVCQTPENPAFYQKWMQGLYASIKKLPEDFIEFLEQDQLKGVNAGVIGGTDVDLIKEYADYALGLVERLTSSNGTQNGNINMIVEQSSFLYFARKANIRLTFLYEESTKKIDFMNRDYTHLIGQQKRNEFNNELVSFFLDIESPAANSKIDHLVTKNFEL